MKYNKNINYVIYVIFVLFISTIYSVYNSNNNADTMILSALAQQSDEAGIYNVASETVNIGPTNMRYYYFYANTNIELTGNFQELNGRSVMVTLYDDSSCNVPYGSVGFDIRTCATLDSFIHNEINPSGNINLPLNPGEYFLTLESASYQDVQVNLNFNVRYDPAIDIVDEEEVDEEEVDEEEVDEEEGNAQVGCPTPGPGGCGGAFDLGGGPCFSPLNPKFGQC